MKNQEPNKETGNLEELFRHHLAEAAVPPAPRVWEQVDNALLLAQNQTYRRRLRVARWVAAASLLLASLAGTGWWAQREIHPAGVAAGATSATGPGAHGLVASGPTPASQPNPAAATAATGERGPGTATESRASALAAASLPPVAAATPGGDDRATTEAGKPAVGGPLLAAASAPAAGSGAHAARRPGPNRTAAGAGGLRAGSAAGVGRGDKTRIEARFATTKGPSQSRAANRRTLEDWRTLDGSVATTGLGLGTATSTAKALPGNAQRATETSAAASSNPALAALPALDGLAVNLLRGPVAALPAPLAMQPLPAAAAESPAAQARRWRLGLSYAAGVFQPNLNFAPAGSAAYSPGPVVSSFSLTQTAAAEYHAQQRPGLSQRLRLQVSRHLRGHWSLATGLEVAQQKSRSSTSYFFTGEQLAYYSQSGPGSPERATNSRYRTAGLPLELRYAGPARTGFSLYGRLGVVVSALLTSRTDVEGSPEATRTYNLLSVSTPYRRVLGTARGAVGVEFRPAGHDYSLSLGPVAEGGLWSLNARPAQSFFQESRPYSFGLEAGLEFGRRDKKAQ